MSSQPSRSRLWLVSRAVPSVESLMCQMAALMVTRMIGYKGGESMKKILISILALASFVACSTEATENTTALYTTSLEVAVESATRSFAQGENGAMVWSWEQDDKIAALQVAGSMAINTLERNEMGNFYCNDFVYSTTDAAPFMFVYPAAALRSDMSVVPVQNGLWTPVLVATTDATTVDAISTVEMNHLTAALELRVWEADRTTAKAVTAATISAGADFLLGSGTTAAVSGLNASTVWFNVAAGEHAFNLTLTDNKGKEHSVAIPAKSFVAGMRTIVNVAWPKAAEPKLSYTIYTSYTNKDNSLDGRSIYVKDIVLTDADSAAVALYLNGNKAADLTVGKTATISGIAPGKYSAVVKWTVDGAEYASEASEVVVSGIPYSDSFYGGSTSAVDAAGWTRNGNTGYQSDLLWLSNNALGAKHGWVASPAVYGAAAYSAKVTVVTKFYNAVLWSSPATMTVYVGATSSPTSSSSSAQSHSSKGSNNTSSTKDLRTGTATISFPAGTQYVSINHNQTTASASYFYLSSYKIEY